MCGGIRAGLLLTYGGGHVVCHSSLCLASYIQGKIISFFVQKVVFPGSVTSRVAY